MEVNASLQAISNMPQISSLPSRPFWNMVLFQPTPIMSTYLVAFIVSDLTCLQTSTVPSSTFSAKEIIVCAQPEQLSTGNYALSVAPQILSFYETYFGIEFPLPKIHLVAIPDFCCGAMVGDFFFFLSLTSPQNPTLLRLLTFHSIPTPHYHHPSRLPLLTPIFVCRRIGGSLPIARLPCSTTI